MTDPLETLYIKGETLKLTVSQISRERPADMRNEKNIGFSIQHRGSVINIVKLRDHFQITIGDYLVWTSHGKLSIRVITDPMSSLSIIYCDRGCVDTTGARVPVYTTRGFGISCEEFEEVITEIFKAFGLSW